MDPILDDLYLCAVDEGATDRLTLALGPYLGGNTCCLWVFEAATGQPHGTFVTDQSSEVVQAYTSHFHTLDPWRKPVMNHLGRATSGAALIPDSQLSQTAFYNDFGRSLGMFHLLAGVMPLGDGLLAAITTHRRREQEPFDESDRNKLDTLLPHLRRAMQLRNLVHRRDGWAEKALDATLDAIAAPAFVCDGTGRVVCANRLAAGLAEAQGIRLVGRAGELAAQVTDSDAAGRFNLLLADAARGGAGGTTQLPQGFVTAGPLPASFAPFGVRPGLVLVSVRLQDEQTIAAKAASLFTLTTAEARVAAAVALGLSPAEAAERRGVALGTVRTLLRRALVKTGSENLRQMATVLARL